VAALARKLSHVAGVFAELAAIVVAFTSLTPTGGVLAFRRFFRHERTPRWISEQVHGHVWNLSFGDN
jgi:hypothetical protein